MLCRTRRRCWRWSLRRSTSPAAASATTPRSPRSTQPAGIRCRSARCCSKRSRSRCAPRGSRTGSSIRPWVRTLAALGYDRDFASVPRTRSAAGHAVARIPGWRAVASTRTPAPSASRQTSALDLGATAKALAADRAAAASRRRPAAGVLVSLGGDIAVAGERPSGGWRDPRQRRPRSGSDAPGQSSRSPAAGSRRRARPCAAGGTATARAVTTSSTRAPAARRDAVADGQRRRRHCVDANIASTAAIVLGEAAPGWLGRARLPTRLVAVDGAELRSPAGPRSRRRMTTTLAAIGPRAAALWYLSRGTGAVALVLLTASVVLGVLNVAAAELAALAAIRRRRRCTANVSLLALVVLRAAHRDRRDRQLRADPARRRGGPIRSAYRPLWLGLGALAFDLLIAVALTSMLRQRIGYRTWRAIHWLPMPAGRSPSSTASAPAPTRRSPGCSC